MDVAFGQVKPDCLRHLVLSLIWEIFTGIPRGVLKGLFEPYAMTGNLG